MRLPALLFPRAALSSAPSSRAHLSTSARPGQRFSNRDSPAALRSVDAFRPTFSVDKLTSLLDHDNHDMRSRFRQFLSDEVMVPAYNVPLEEEREVALRRLQWVCDHRFISVLDFWKNPLRIFAAHELAAVIDPVRKTRGRGRPPHTQKKHCFFPLL